MIGNKAERRPLLTIFLIVKLIFVHFSHGQSTDVQGSTTSQHGEFKTEQKEVWMNSFS